MIGHLLREAAQAGIRRAVIVVPPEDRELPAYCRQECRRLGISLELVIQPEPVGVADALLRAAAAVAEPPVLAAMPDTLFSGNDSPLEGVTAASRRTGLTSIAIIRVGRQGARGFGNCGRVRLGAPLHEDPSVVPIAEPTWLGAPQKAVLPPGASSSTSSHSDR